jgi:hypothetical protein
MTLARIDGEHDVPDWRRVIDSSVRLALVAIEQLG